MRDGEPITPPFYGNSGTLIQVKALCTVRRGAMPRLSRRIRSVEASRALPTILQEIAKAMVVVGPVWQVSGL